MSQGRPERVRVTGPPRRRGAASRTGEIDDETEVGAVYVASLVREQLRLALRILALLAAGLGSLPLAFHLVPRLAGAEVLGLPVAWLVLGILVYPFLLLLGWRYVRSAEANERDFADLVGGQEPPP